MANKRKNYDGMKINNFTVIKRSYRDKDGDYWFLCRCDCGREFLVEQGNMMAKKSCGCMTKALQLKAHYKHGGANDRLYRVWYAMKGRCNNPNNPAYANYGGRGIKVCPEWESDYSKFKIWAYENGYNDKAKRTECTLDRINVNGDYSPANCRWVGMIVQANNMRTNRRIECNGVEHTISEWSKISGVDMHTIRYRISKGWNIERAIYIKPYGGRNEKNNRKE